MDGKEFLNVFKIVTQKCNGSNRVAMIKNSL